MDRVIGGINSFLVLSRPQELLLGMSLRAVFKSFCLLCRWTPLPRRLMYPSRPANARYWRMLICCGAPCLTLYSMRFMPPSRDKPLYLIPNAIMARFPACYGHGQGYRTGRHAPHSGTLFYPFRRRVRVGFIHCRTNRFRPRMAIENYLDPGTRHAGLP